MKHVLVVDDEAAIRFGIGVFLRSSGYAVDEEGGRVGLTARRLGIPRSSLHNELKRYGVESKN